jgi:hypothetical protein
LKINFNFKESDLRVRHFRSEAAVGCLRTEVDELKRERLSGA